MESITIGGRLIPAILHGNVLAPRVGIVVGRVLPIVKRPLSARRLIHNIIVYTCGDDIVASGRTVSVSPRAHTRNRRITQTPTINAHAPTNQTHTNTTLRPLSLLTRILATIKSRPLKTRQEIIRRQIWNRRANRNHQRRHRNNTQPLTQ